MKKIITAQDIRDARKAGQTSLTHPADAIVTPQARDDARAYGIALQSARADAVLENPVTQGKLEPPKQTMPIPKPLQSPEPLQFQAPVQSQMPAQGQPSPSGQKALWDMVRAQVAAKLGPAFDAAAVEAVIEGMAGGHQAQEAVHVAGQTAGVAAGQEVHGVTLVQYSGLPGGAGSASSPSGVLLTDVLAPDASGPGVGYLEFASSSFELVFPADEVVTVLEGELCVTVQEKSVVARTGEAVRIAAGVSASLSATGPVRCLYTAWPR